MFNNLDQRTIETIYKGLSTNNFAQLKGPAGQTNGSAFIPESLDTTLRSLTYSENNLQLWKDIAKTPAYSTVEEYNVINNYGEEVSAFAMEGIAGIDTTGNYSREVAKVKCLNTTRSVSHLMTLVNTVADPETIEIKSGTQYLLGQAEQALFYGDSTLAANKEEGLEFDGVLKKADSANTIDLKGDYLTDKHVNDAAATILNNYGMATKMYLPVAAARIFSEQYYPDQRALMNVQAGNVVAGTNVTQFNSAAGTIDIKPDVFMRRGLIPLNPNTVAVGEKSPTPPTLTVALDETVTDATHEKGTIKYAVVAVSSQGSSVPVESDAVAITDGKNGVKLTIKNSPQQINSPDYFIVYRTEKDGQNYYEIGRIGAVSREKNAITIFTDKNETLPNTATAIIGDFRQEAIEFKQLAPLFKLDYALTGPIKRFGVFLYGMPVIYMPKRFSVIKNIKVK